MQHGTTILSILSLKLHRNIMIRRISVSMRPICNMQCHVALQSALRPFSSQTQLPVGGMNSKRLINMIKPRPVSPNIFILGLPDGLTNKDIEDRLSEYGEIKLVKIFPSPPQYKSSSALVCFRRVNSALCAIDELNQTLVMGRRVTVELSKYGSQQGQGWKHSESRQMNNNTHSNRMNTPKSATNTSAASTPKTPAHANANATTENVNSKISTV